MTDLHLLPFNFPSMAGHLWFMYPLISLYLIIPIVSPWLGQATANEERIFIGIFTFTTLTPWLHRFVSPELWGECFWNGFSAFWYCSGYIGYLVLAHYIRTHLTWQKQKRLIIGGVCFLVGATFTAWSFWWKGEPQQSIETPMLEWAWEFCTPNVLLATFGIFLMFTCIHQTEAPQIVTKLSKISFGMYLMHMFFLEPIATALIAGNVAAPLLPVAITIPLIAMLTFICCAVTCWIISHIPYSKYIIGE